MARDFEVALAEFDDGPPRRVTLIGRSGDPRLVEIARRFFACGWPPVVPLHLPHGGPRFHDRRPLARSRVPDKPPGEPRK